MVVFNIQQLLGMPSPKIFRTLSIGVLRKASGYIGCNACIKRIITT